MTRSPAVSTGGRGVASILAFALLITMFAFTPAAERARAAGDVTIAVTDRATGAPVTPFRYVINEDIATPPGDSPSLVGPKSYSPIVARGERLAGTDPIPSVTLPPGRYLVSVLAGSGLPDDASYKMSGTHFTIPEAGGIQDIVVPVIANPLPTSSITVVVHHDNWMVNGAQDIPVEDGLAGFSILLEDGTGEVSVDFYGNPLCTTYVDNDPNQGVDQMGGACITDANGEVTIPNLPPLKYGVWAIPPDGSGWIQTSTIEGTHVVDSWVEEGNPGILTEGAAVGPLVQLGYVQACEFGLCPNFDQKGQLVFPKTPSVPGGTNTIVGTVHEASEAGGEFNLTPGAIIDRPYVALNNLSGSDEQIYTGRGLADGSFSIPNVAPGIYQLVVWDEPQNYIITFETVVVPDGDGQVIEAGDILLASWFGHIQGFAYEDNGLTPDGRTILIEEPTNQGPDGTGWANGFRDCMPDATGPFDYDNCEEGIPNQDFVIHFNDGSVKYGGVADSHGFYSFDTHFPYGHYMIWEVGFGRGRQMYTTGYFTDFDDAGNVVPLGYPYEPRNKTGEPDGASLLQAEITLAGFYGWIDTGKVPYTGTRIPGDISSGDANPDPLIDNGGISGVVRYAVTRNEFDPRVAAPEDYEPGIPNVTINLYRAVMNGATTVKCETQGPGCPYGNGEVMRVSTGTGVDAGDLVDSVASDSYFGLRPTDCTFPDLTTVPATTQFDATCQETPLNVQQIQDGAFDGGYAFDAGMAPGDYVVEVVPPPNYRHLKEEDQNTDQGDNYIPAVEPAYCAGPLHLVNDPRNPENGNETPLCDSKLVEVKTGINPAADFYLMGDFDDSVDDLGNPTANFTGTVEVPVPGFIRGIMFDDLTTQFNADSVMFGGKKGVPNTSLGFLDYQGNEIATTMTDADGFFEVLLPSSNVRLCPTPGGVCPAMYLVVGNYPGQDPSHPIDGYNPAYQTLTVTLDVWTGKTTYADVAILPISGFGFTNAPACTPLGPDVESVSAVVAPAGTSFDILGAGFGGTTGTVRIGATNAAVNTWTDTGINVTVPNGTPTGAHQLTVSDSAGLMGETGITIHVTGAGYNPTVRNVGTSQTYASIQAALDAASQPNNNGTPDLVVVHPGTYYESPIIGKRVKLQGYGPGVTFIDGRYLGFGNGTLFDAEAWLAKVASITAEDVPIGQVVTVLASSNGTHTFGGGPGATNVANRSTQIDGFTITGGDSQRTGNANVASQGGGIYAHTNAAFLQVSNDVVQSNGGQYGGGIILGQPYVGDNDNDDVRIHHNRVLNNGGTFLAGGIGIFNGAQRYRVDHNVVCGNQSAEYGGGISHFGDSGFNPNGNNPPPPNRIDHNRIVFNSAFDEGGGIMIAGEQPLDPGVLTEGSGQVTIDGNLIQYNLSNDDGGGIRLLAPESNGGGPANSDRVRIVNNMVVDNLATDYGGGIALDDAPDTAIVNNTVATNVSTATAEDADATSCAPVAGATCPHGAGLTATPFSAQLTAAVHSTFIAPTMFNNIIWHNTAWYLNGNQGLIPLSQAAGWWDLELVGSAMPFDSTSSVFSDAADPFVASVTVPFTALAVLGLPNFIGVEITATPQSPQGDYHITAANGVGVAGGIAPSLDFDGDPRVPDGTQIDAGADEYVPAPAPAVAQ